MILRGLSNYLLTTILLICIFNCAHALNLLSVSSVGERVPRYNGSIEKPAISINQSAMATDPGEEIFFNLSQSSIPEAPEYEGWVVYDCTVPPHEAVPRWQMYRRQVHLMAAEFLPAVEPVQGTLGNRVLHINTQGGSSPWYISLKDDKNWIDGLTVAWRSKPISSGYGVISSQIKLIKGWQSTLRVEPYNNRVFLEENTASYSFADSEYNINDWNTFRLTMKGNQVKLYINENPEPVINTTSMKYSGENAIWFGPHGDNYAGYHDWIIYNMEGAYAPDERSLPFQHDGDHPLPDIGNSLIDDILTKIDSPDSALHHAGRVKLQENLLTTVDHLEMIPDVSRWTLAPYMYKTVKKSREITSRLVELFNESKDNDLRFFILALTEKSWIRSEELITALQKILETETLPPGMKAMITNAQLVQQKNELLDWDLFRGFQHPMTVFNSDELHIAKKRILESVLPQSEAYPQMIQEANQALTLEYVPNPPATLDIPDASVRPLLWDNSQSAYACALAYRYTGDTRYANRVVEILNGWALKGTTFTGKDAGLQLGSYFSGMVYAADLLHDYYGWKHNDRNRFLNWWREDVLAHTLRVMRTRTNNWLDAGLLGVFASAVVLEDEELFREALETLTRYYEGTWKMVKDGNGVYLPEEVVREEGKSGLTYTAYSLTTWVQALEIARYGGFNLWYQKTETGAGMQELLQQTFRWEIEKDPFPWNSSPNITRQRKNYYEIGNNHFNLSDKIKEYLRQTRPVNGEQGDRFATLNKGNIASTTFPGADAGLDAITWPDIPNSLRDLPQWNGDTIPGFASGTIRYRLLLPADTEAIPALVAKTRHVNATVKVTRAKSLYGSKEDRTIIFEVTSENGENMKRYFVELVKEKDSANVEPFHADPFISEFVNNYPHGVNYVEIYNPGNQLIDLRNYMLAMRLTDDLYGAITWNASWEYRYTTYIPGLKHQDEQAWVEAPRKLIPDPKVDPILPPGETFVLAHIIRDDNNYPGISAFFPPYDVQFANQEVPGHSNPWNEQVRATSSGGAPLPVNGNRTNSMFLYKVLNDSVKTGLKPNNDPFDFEVIDVWGMPDKQYWVIGGHALGVNEGENLFIRKPEIIKGNPHFAGSFGTSPDDCEWERIQPNTQYHYIDAPERYGPAWSNLNQHSMVEPTGYKSTVTSRVYKVSEGFGPDEKIFGIKVGTTVTQFLNNIIKEDPGQLLKVITADDNTVLDPESAITMNDMLIVVSADSVNSTHYRLEANQLPEPPDAYLTSNRWTIMVNSSPGDEQTNYYSGTGTISGFAPGTPLRTILQNVWTVAADATLTIIDEYDAYVPITLLNYDTTYVEVTASQKIFFEVVAGDGLTKMIYQLIPDSDANDVILQSDHYIVNQSELNIAAIPKGTSNTTLLSNLIPSPGAFIRIESVAGDERTYGLIREDDQVVITSANGEVVKTYTISFLQPRVIIPIDPYPIISSDAYLIDAINHVITSGVIPLTGSTTLTEFLSNITIIQLVIVTVVDNAGNEKTGGVLNKGDRLQVSLENGTVIAMYDFDLDLTSVRGKELSREFIVYPNPTTGKLLAHGVEPGYSLEVYNTTGGMVYQKMVEQNPEKLDISELPAGMYLIMVLNDRQISGRIKCIKK